MTDSRNDWLYLPPPLVSDDEAVALRLRCTVLKTRFEAPGPSLSQLRAELFATEQALRAHFEDLIFSSYRDDETVVAAEALRLQARIEELTVQIARGERNEHELI